MAKPFGQDQAISCGRWNVLCFNDVFMRRVIVLLFVLGLVLPVFGLNKPDLDARVRRLTAKFEALQSKPDKRVPPEILKKSKGIILLDRTKAGFVFAYQGGSGVALLKDGSTWGNPAFLRANEASLGFQVGGQQSFIAIVLMHTNAVNSLSTGQFSFGGEARGTAGDQTAVAQGSINSDNDPVLVYSDVAGLYGGAAIKGGLLTADTDANVIYYEEFTSLSEILTSKQQSGPTPAVRRLQEALVKAAK